MFKKIVDRFFIRATPCNNITISDNLVITGRILYTLMLTTKQLSPWYLQEIIKQTLALPKETAIKYADKYLDALDVDKELAGSMIFAVKKIAPTIIIDDAVKTVVKGSLALPTSWAYEYARVLDNYIDLRSYILNQHLDYIEKEATR